MSVIGAETNNTGSAAAAQHTVMGDVNFGLEKVVGMLPQSLKERIAGVNDPKGKMTQQEAAYRLSPHGECAALQATCDTLCGLR